MFRGRNHTNKTDFFNRTNESDTETWTRLSRSWVFNGWVRRSELCVWEKTVCHLSRLHSLSFIKISCYVYMKLSVEVRTTQVFGYFINVECQWD
jgi:hypothetical protein